TRVSISILDRTRRFATRPLMVSARQLSRRTLNLAGSVLDNRTHRTALDSVIPKRLHTTLTGPRAGLGTEKAHKTASRALSGCSGFVALEIREVASSIANHAPRGGDCHGRVTRLRSESNLR